MARSKGTVGEEQRAYSAVFLLGVGLLLAGAVWAVWDDNVSRRPWKKYQGEFLTLQLDRARQGVVNENARLEANPEYQQITRELAAGRADGGPPRPLERAGAQEDRHGRVAQPGRKPRTADRQGGRRSPIGGEGAGRQTGQTGRRERT